MLIKNHFNSYLNQNIDNEKLTVVFAVFWVAVSVVFLIKNFSNYFPGTAPPTTHADLLSAYPTRP
jgi:hypothetical protein